MTQAHYDELVQQLGEYGEFCSPVERIKQLPDKWVSLTENPLFMPNDVVPPGLSKENPIVEHEGHLYVYCSNDTMPFAIQYGERREGMPDAQPLMDDYADEVTAIESLGGCLHHLCELSFGFSVTHHNYVGDEPDKLLALIEQVHGKSAAGTLQTAADAIGYSSLPGMEEFCSQELVRNLLQIAQVQSDWHRGYRV